MLRKLRFAMGDQSRFYQLSGVTELDYALAALRVLTENHHHIAKITPSELADEELLWVHIVISNFKSYWLDNYHGISGHYVQDTRTSFTTV